eukprot:CAMPEP_0183298092 /NCGR_PEP_ID=MMETSP0160_2-20130417/5213_1 /TAXON_ID=2839 ORGANISM="Odontella Sinensis, Strain Grunow 1884" /NCGR_SAMPLE_ID=MMETSP0160_2 /ASSEMBLY_ACC=CAM_ASM_000250 /LENGTH=255 /DNA_ID=CAMNT_0025460047 /DNA_START=677 /DNA_END=1441 /DNA_ORIENTATION=+
MDDAESTNLHEFLDSAADLKNANVAELTESERLAFFLNLYHVMVMHAYLVLGVPDSSFKWVSYFSMIAYQCSDDIFSLAELEHCIIRAQMSSPSQFVAKFALPKSHYRFELARSKRSSPTELDFRINFALNCGSMTNPRSVPIYKANILSEQLNSSMREYVSKSVKVTRNPKSGNINVTLPRVCSWYAADFSRGRPMDVFSLVFPYLPEDAKNILSKAQSEGTFSQRGSLQFSFSSYDYKCRQLVLRKEAKEGEA